jgi:hypothetical protein
MTAVRPAGGGSPALPREWRIPPWQPAALFLAVSALAAYDIYGSPSLSTVVATAFLAVVFAVLGAVAARYLLVADEDGLWVRGIRGEQHVAWPDFKEVEVVPGRRGSTTIRIVRVDGSWVDVPPSLLLPTLPMKIANARAVMYDVAGVLADLGEARRRV